MVKDKSGKFLEIIERLARLEEIVRLGLKDAKEEREKILEHTQTTNHEMGDLEKRVGMVEKLYLESKTRYDKMSAYWKVIALVISPIVTFTVTTLIKLILGLSIP